MNLYFTSALGVDKLKIALVVPHFFWAFGGHEYYLAQELARLGAQVRVFSSNILPTRYFRKIEKIKPGLKKVEGLFEIIWLDTLFEIRQIPFFKLKNVLQDYRPDIVHAQEIFPFCSQEAFYISKRIGVPFIFTQHKYDYPRGTWKVAWQVFEHSLGKYLTRYSSHITAISSAAKYFLIHTMSVPEGHISVIPLGVETTQFKPNVEDEIYLKRRLGLEGKRVILFVGRLTHVKGVHILIKAFLRIHQVHPEACLLIRGDGEQRDSLLELVKTHGLERSTIFLPFLEREELPFLYAISDIFVLPSLKEPFGLVLLEAMASGKPVVGSNVGGIPDIIEEAVNGFLVRPGQIEELTQRLEILLRDEKMRVTMGSKGREIAERRFDYKVIAKEYLKVYRRCIEVNAR